MATAKGWLRIMQQASNYNHAMTPLIIKYGEMLIEERDEISPRVAKLILQMRDIYIQTDIIDDPNAEEMWHLLYQIASPNYDKLYENVWSEIEKIASKLNNVSNE